MPTGSSLAGLWQRGPLAGAGTGRSPRRDPRSSILWGLIAEEAMVVAPAVQQLDSQGVTRLHQCTDERRITPSSQAPGLCEQQRRLKSEQRAGLPLQPKLEAGCAVIILIFMSSTPLFGRAKCVSESVKLESPCSVRTSLLAFFCPGCCSRSLVLVCSGWPIPWGLFLQSPWPSWPSIRFASSRFDPWSSRHIWAIALACRGT